MGVIAGRVQRLLPVIGGSGVANSTLSSNLVILDVVNVPYPGTRLWRPPVVAG